jgi:hypothetical protein
MSTTLDTVPLNIPPAKMAMSPTVVAATWPRACESVAVVHVLVAVL